MANAIKSTRGAVGHLLKHYGREKDEKGEYVKFGNQQIDPSRTHLNYELGHNRTNKEKLDFLHRRLDEVRHLNRKNINVMCSWVVTVPDNVPKERQKEFFELTHSWLCNRYGEENCIGSSVHMDETTPHMHFYFVPVQKCTDKDGQPFEKLNAKDVVCRKDLQTFHQDLASFLAVIMRFRPNILKDEVTKTIGNQSISELKKTTYSLEHMAKELGSVTSKKSLFRKGKVTVKEEDVEKLQKVDGLIKIAEKIAEQSYEVQNMVQNEQDRVRRMEDDINKLRADKKALEDEVKLLKGSNKALDEKVASIDTLAQEKSVLEGKIGAKDKEIEKLKADLKLEKLKNDNLTRSQADYDKLAKQLDDTIKERKSLMEENEYMKDLCYEKGVFTHTAGRSR